MPQVTIQEQLNVLIYNLRVNGRVVSIEEQISVAKTILLSLAHLEAWFASHIPWRICPVLQYQDSINLVQSVSRDA